VGSTKKFVLEANDGELSVIARNPLGEVTNRERRKKRIPYHNPRSAGRRQKGGENKSGDSNNLSSSQPKKEKSGDDCHSGKILVTSTRYLA